MQQDNLQKKSNSIGYVFLSVVILYIITSLSLNLLDSKNIELPTALTLILSELIILVPGLVYVIKYRLGFEELGFRKIKAGTVFMTILLSFLVMPVVSFVNILTQFFVSNTMVQASDSLLEGNQLFVLFLAGIYGPLCEEFVFRSVIANGYGRISTALKAAIASALLFGLMHMNLNQACYAFVLGVIFVIVNKASNSVITSMIIHIVINTSNMAMLIVTSAVYSAMGINLAESTESIRTTDTIYTMAGIYFVLAIIFGAICIPCIVFIAKHEGNFEELVSMFMRKEKAQDENSPKLLLNIPIIISVALCLFTMFGLPMLLTALGFVSD